jgi:hypothetical protein
MPGSTDLFPSDAVCIRVSFKARPDPSAVVDDVRD